MIAAIFAAFPQELKHICKLPATQNPKSFPSPSLGKHHLTCGIITVQTGMGTMSTETAFRRVFQKNHPDIVLSVGFGGALYEGAQIGDIVWSTRALLFQQERMHQHEHSEDTIYGSDIIRLIKDKLHEKTEAKEGSIVTITEMMTKSKIRAMISDNLPYPVCDMETYYLAKLSNQYRVPFVALRSITDRLDENIPPELLAVTNGIGRYRLSRAIVLLLAKPTLIPASVRLGRSASKASKKLGKAVDILMEILSDCPPGE